MVALWPDVNNSTARLCVLSPSIAKAHPSEICGHWPLLLRPTHNLQYKNARICPQSPSTTPSRSTVVLSSPVGCAGQSECILSSSTRSPCANDPGLTMFGIWGPQSRRSTECSIEEEGTVRRSHLPSRSQLSISIRLLLLKLRGHVART